MSELRDVTTATDDPGYGPSPRAYVRNQVRDYLASGGTERVTQGGYPVIVITMIGRRSGLVRRVPLIKVEHDRTYAAVGSDQGAKGDPAWIRNLRARPEALLRDRTEEWPVTAREVSGPAWSTWWQRAVEVFPTYLEYRSRTDRDFPIMVLEARGDG